MPAAYVVNVQVEKVLVNVLDAAVFSLIYPIPPLVIALLLVKVLDVTDNGD